MKVLKIPKIISVCKNTDYKNYSYRLPYFIDTFICTESKGEKMKIIDGLCLYALDLIKGRVLSIDKKDHSYIKYSLDDYCTMIDCSKRLKASNHYLSERLTLILSGFLMGHSLSVKITVLCFIAINSLNKNKELIIAY